MQTIPMTLHIPAEAVAPGPYPAATVAAHSRRNPRCTDALRRVRDRAHERGRWSHVYEHPKV